MKFNIPELRSRASAALQARNEQTKNLISTYTMVWVGIYLIGNLLSLTINDAYNDLSGLMSVNKGNRLLAISLLASLVSSVAVVLLDAGYSASILKLTKNQEEPSLLWGLHNFPRLLVCGLQMLPLFFLLSYGGILLVLLLLPTDLWFAGEALAPVLLNLAYGICSVIFFWLLYNRRLLYFFLADFEENPGCVSGRAAVLLLRGYRWQFFRIDLHHWWYYALMALAMALPFGSQLLPQASAAVTLVADIVLLLLTAALKGLLFLRAKNRLWAMYALAFQDILQEKAARELPPESPLQ